MRNIVIILILIMAATILSALYTGPTPKDSVRPLPSEGVPASYSLKEMQDIWTNNFQDVLEKKLFANKYPLPKIQERFNLQRKLIEEKFRTNLAIHLVTTYNPESHDIMAGCSVISNQPQLDIVIPKLVDIYYDQRSLGDEQWQLRMQDDVIASVMHECDHLAFGLVIGSREHPSSIDELVDSESSAWALTCEYTLRPMIEEYKVPLTRSDHIYYEKWVENGRNEKSPLWRDFIRSHYETTRR